MSEDNARSFAEIFERERKRRGWTQQKIADELGITVDTVRRWKNKNQLPQRSQHEPLQELFGMNLAQLGLIPAEIMTEEQLETDQQTPAVLVNDRTGSSSNNEATGIDVEPRNPYKGLSAFQEADAADFFGRDQLINSALAFLRDILAREERGDIVERLLAIIGPGGFGKSSVVQAGLLPGLKAGVLPGSQQWVYLPSFVPGKHPVETLASVIGQCLPYRTISSIHETLSEQDGRGLHALADTLVMQPGGKVVLFIDQFEELFTQTEDEQERQQFINLLMTAVDEPAGPLLVILTLRADFSDRPMYYPALGKLLERRHIPIFPPEVEELRAIIEQPAALTDVQLTFEDTLVENILLDIHGQQGSLPLLQFTLALLFQQREGHLLTLRAYEKIGGVKGAIARHAEQTFSRLPSDAHRQMARVLFLRLIVSSETAYTTTRRSAVAEDFAFTDIASNHIMQEVIEAFTNARLLTRTGNYHGEVTIECSHEAIIREWPRFVIWQHEYMWDTHLQQRIAADSKIWEERGKRWDRLYRGSQLGEAQAWKKRNIQNKREGDFLRASERRQRFIRISSLASFILILIVLYPFVATLIGNRTFLSSPIEPGGWWINPQEDSLVHSGILDIAAYAYPSLPIAPSIAYVDFTMRWSGPYAWFTACRVTTHTANNMYQCDVNLAAMKTPPGIILVSFNVMDTKGNESKAPNGVRSIVYEPSP